MKTTGTQKDTNSTEKNKVSNIIAFWLVALGVLLLVLYIAMKFFIPKAENPRPLASVDITETLAKAIEIIISQTPPTPTSSPSLTPSPSRTPLPTFTPSVTPTPTITPSSTPSPLPPTLTIAYPVSTPAAYQMRPWSPAYADEIIRFMEAYPERLRLDNPSLSPEAYNPAYTYASLLQAKAILRFPNSPETETWQWNYAFISIFHLINR